MESRERKLLRAPPREAVPVPGAPAAFGRGFWQRYRKSKRGCLLTGFLGAGLAIFLFGVANLGGPFAPAEIADPRGFQVATAFGAVFFLVALRMLQIELTGSEHRRRRGRGASHWKPWTSDYPWHPQGMDPDYSAPGGGHVLGTVVVFSLIAMFNLAFFDDASWVARAVLLVFDLFGLLILLDAVLKILQALRRVRPRMRWATFPAFLGERLEGVFTTERPLSAIGPVQATLRCVRDEWTEHKDVDEDTGRETRDRHLIPYVLYTRSLEVPVEGRIRQVPFAFDLPSDLPGTDLMRKEAVYWQVVVEVPLKGPDFDAVFLAPVYERRSRKSTSTGPV